jgi:hypothetical protein
MKGTFEATRFNCMESLLARQKWTTLDVQNLLQWLHYPLNIDRQIKFTKVNGISFNIKTGKIQFLFRVAQSNENGLFDANDVVEVLIRGITSSLFTLEQPTGELQLHPFQEMLYFPNNFLLKMISTGVDVYSEPPFELGDASNGFIKRLLELKPIDEGENCVIINSVHRFWQTTFEHHFDDEANLNKLAELVFKVCHRLHGKSIISHCLMYGQKSELISFIVNALETYKKVLESIIYIVDRYVKSIDGHMLLKNTNQQEKMATNTRGDSHKGLPDEHKPTGRTEPRNLNEQIAMKDAIEGAANGKVLSRVTLKDSRWPAKDGWVKMRYYHESTKIVIHYVRNTKTGQSTDFKYKKYKR